jgi:hypothetical protein
MRNTIKEAKRNRDARISTSKETKKIISGENSLNRESEVNLNNDKSSLKKLNNRFNAQRELSGNYMYSISNSDPKEKNKIISKEDISNRAFEIYQENDHSSSNELDNWFYAERELNGYYL